MKQFRYWTEHILLLFIHGICKVLPWSWSSNALGKLASIIGPKMAINRKAVKNIRAALNCSDETAHEIAKGHWDNLGRIIAEYPNLKTIATNNVCIKGLEHIIRLRDDGKAGILFGGHLGNWEVIPYALLQHANFSAHPVYRPPNNPMVDKRLHAYRSPKGQLMPLSKSRKGMMGMVKALKNKEHIGLLIDQKYNEGINFPFFGMNARTGTAFIELAKKYDCPLLPIRCIRENNGFCIEVSPPITTLNRKVEDVLSEAHTLLEKWILEEPNQWLWLHRRWRAEDLKDVD